MTGGLGASLLLGQMYPDAMATLSDRMGRSRNVVLTNFFVRLALGWVLAWLYAAARFRLRSTLRTAVRIGLAVWFLVYIPYAWMLGNLEALPWSVLGVLVPWGLFECLVAALLAGLVHRRLKPEYTRY